MRIFGSGPHTYRAVEGWGRGPDGWEFGIVCSVATDSQDRVYAIDREPNPAVVVMDRSGRLLNTWGQDFFRKPHSIWIGPDDIVWITDCDLHTVTSHSLDGELLSTFGTPGEPGAPGRPFNRPTWAVRGNHDDIYVSDGYGQNYVHRFSADGELLCSWGGDGTGPGEFDLPHGIRVDRDDRVLVADRTNKRIQIFDVDGHCQEQWTHRHDASRSCRAATTVRVPARRARRNHGHRIYQPERDPDV